MMARIRKSMENKEKGFTLIELLVVIIIIGILAAIAIPVFLNQRKKAVDSGMKSDLRTIATAEETYFVDYQHYLAVAASTAPVVGAETVKMTQGNTAVVTVGTSDFCVVVSRVSGSQPGSQASWVYKSAAGGIQGVGVLACT